MRKVLACLLLGIIVVTAAFPVVVQAAITAYIDITATGDEPGGLPGAPTNFVAVATSDHLITLTWLKGINADNTVIYGKWGSYPTAIGDGWLVYSDNGTTDTDFQNIAGSEEGLYYCAWSQNIAGYSIGYVTAHVEGGLAGVADAIIFIPMVMLCGVLSGMGFWKIRGLWPILVIAALAWGALGFWSFSNVESAYDVWFFVGCIGVLSLLAHVVLGPWRWIMEEEKPAKQESERVTDRIKKRKWRRTSF